MSENAREQHQEVERCAHCGLSRSKLPGGMIYKNGVLLCLDDLGCKERATKVSDRHVCGSDE